MYINSITMFRSAPLFCVPGQTFETFTREIYLVYLIKGRGWHQPPPPGTVIFYWLLFLLFTDGGSPLGISVSPPFHPILQLNLFAIQLNASPHPLWSNRGNKHYLVYGTRALGESEALFRDSLARVLFHLGHTTKQLDPIPCADH